MGDFLDLFTSGVAGSVVGGLFGWLNRKEDNKAASESMKLKIEMMKVESATKVDQLDAESFKESQKTLSKIGGAIKSAVRPLITGALLVQTMHIQNNLDRLVGGLESLPTEELVSMYSQVNHDIIALTAMSVAWWFAARMPYTRK